MVNIIHHFSLVDAIGTFKEEKKKRIADENKTSRQEFNGRAE